MHIRIKVMVVFAKRQDYAHSIMLYRKLALKVLFNDFRIHIIRRVIRSVYQIHINPALRLSLLKSVLLNINFLFHQPAKEDITFCWLGFLTKSCEKWHLMLNKTRHHLRLRWRLWSMKEMHIIIIMCEIRACLIHVSFLVF